MGIIDCKYCSRKSPGEFAVVRDGALGQMVKVWRSDDAGASWHVHSLTTAKLRVQ